MRLLNSNVISCNFSDILQWAPQITYVLGKKFYNRHAYWDHAIFWCYAKIGSLKQLFDHLLSDGYTLYLGLNVAIQARLHTLYV